MRRLGDYADDAVRFASPYVKRTGEFFENAGDSAKDWYYTKKRAYMRKYHPTALEKLCDAISGSMRLIMIIVSIAGGIVAALLAARAIANKFYFSKHRIIGYNETDEAPEEAQDASDEQTDAESDAEPEDDEAIKKEKGYIVL